MTHFPPAILTESRAAPAALPPPSAEQIRIATSVQEDDTKLKAECEKPGSPRTWCRDPRHYVKTNEHKSAVFHKYIQNLGGGYVGVGAEQNYSFIAAAKPEWVWLFDYDPIIVKTHRMLRSLILSSDGIDDFVSKFAQKNKTKSISILRRDPQLEDDRKGYDSLFSIYRNTFFQHFHKSRNANPYDSEFGWLRSEEKFQYIKRMFEQGRIITSNGDMLGTKTMLDIGNAAKQLGVPIRIYYPSNAPEFWPWTDEYKKNVLNLPFDDKSVVLQTLSEPRRRNGQQDYWHYNIEYGPHLHHELRKKGLLRLGQIVFEHLPAPEIDLSLVGLPSAGHQGSPGRGP